MDQKTVRQSACCCENFAPLPHMKQKLVQSETDDFARWSLVRSLAPFWQRVGSLRQFLHLEFAVVRLPQGVGAAGQRAAVSNAF